MEATVAMEILNANAEEMQRIKDERDALAAHVGRLRYLRAETLEQDCHEILDKWLAETPATSLARREALVAEQALSSAHTKLSERREWVAAHHLLLVAAEINDTLRRQAEEPQ